MGSLKVSCPHIGFFELLARSNFSFLQGASHPEEMVRRALGFGYKGLALCDLNGLYGVVRGFQTIRNPSHFHMEDALELERNPDFRFLSGAEIQLADRTSIALLPMNRDGYFQLCRLITLAKREAPKGFSSVTFEDILEHSEDLIALPLPPWNPEQLRRLMEVFYDRLYVPVWRDFTWESRQILAAALEIEQHLGLPLFVTQRPLMHSPDRKPLHDVLSCILHKTTLEKARNLLTTNRERHLRPLNELSALWADRPDLLQRTCEIASRVSFSLEQLHYQYPQAITPEGMGPDQHLRHLCEQGLKWRYPDGAPDKVHRLLEYELEIICDLRYEDYFLTLWDICRFAKEQNILFQGRGSAANSVVCFCLGLTSVDPRQIELMFERFISRERGEPPDIDIDFESQRREEVIQYVYKKYGSDHAAMVCTVICYRGRMALRETAKVLGISDDIASRLIRMMGRDGFRFLKENPEKALEMGLSAQQVRLLFELAAQIVGFPRHLSIHTGGFVISQRPITECVPVEKATMDQRYVVQWNKDDIDALKLMKVDLLGLGMLTALRKSFELLREHKNIHFNLATLPQNDRPTYQMVQEADTVGVFQIESRAQMSLLPRLKPKCFYDLVIEVAIVRPGPLQGGMVHPYLRRRDGLEKPTYPHKDLISVLNKTLGVPIFQEQVMQIASRVCGFTPGEADELRRVMSSAWRRHEVMSGLKNRLLSGMLSHGLNRRDAEQIYKTIEGFASYGFPESHAASFALLTYASCYIKKHHPDVFVCSLLNSQPMGFYSPRSLIADAQRHGVQFSPVDVQHSLVDYSLQNEKVRVGFKSIFGLQQRWCEQLVARRGAQPFMQLRDFIRRTELPLSALVRLASADAFACLGLTPRQALWRLQGLCLDPESLFFGQARESWDESPDRETLPTATQWDELKRQYHSQGYSIEHHPIGLLRPKLQQRSLQFQRQGKPPYRTSQEIKNIKNGERIRMGGLISIRQKPPTAKGFTFLTVEDEFGFFNIVIPPSVYTPCREVINFHTLIEVRGRLERSRGTINVKADEVLPLFGLPEIKEMTEGSAADVVL